VTPELVSPVGAADAHNVPLASRTLGAGRHPLAAGCNSVAVVFADHGVEPPNVVVSSYSNAGVAQGTTQLAQAEISTPDPGVAALPDGSFAVAWTDFGVDGDELGISLQRVIPGASQQGASIVANEGSAFSQSNSDIVFDGSELVVAWADSSDASSGPDLRYRLFSSDLTPLTGDLTLANTSAAEDDVVLAGQGGQWAAAWRSGSNGVETIEVQSGATHWTVGPFMPGKTGDRPDLAFLDATHLAVAFTMGTDPNNTGTADTPRLRAAVLDVASPGLVASFAVPPAQDPYAVPTASQSEPSLFVAPDHLLVGWRTGALAGDSGGAELWARRVPVTVNSDHSVTIDPSHIEVPLVQTAAQRVGDQNAFRLLGTQLWPSGGLVTAWDDASHSFGATAGVPDVALQFLSDFVEPGPAVTAYPLSADGKYYYVNLLRRNYAGPAVVNTTFANDAVLYQNYGAQYVYDGDDSEFVWGTPTASDPDATVVVTLDMGQVYAVGAVRQAYYAYWRAPQQFQVRLAATPGQWTTVVPLNAVGSLQYDIISSFDSTAARYIELTMVGSSTNQGYVNLPEFFVYPSTHVPGTSTTLPSPTTNDGYDFTYLGAASFTATNMTNIAYYTVWPLRALYPVTTATSDAVATFDLGGQYSTSEIDLALTNGYNGWAGGGKLEAAAIPEAWSVIADSGRGTPFATSPLGPAQFLLPTPEPIRYLRLTDYYVPGSGPSPAPIVAIQAFGSTAPPVTNYPLGDSQSYYRVNLLRRPASATQATATAAFANGAQLTTLTGNAPGNAFDGDDLPFEWITSAANSSATATLTIDLGQTMSVGAIRQHYISGGRSPLNFQLRVAQTLGTWTTAISSTSEAAAGELVSSFTPQQARYVELTMIGTRNTSPVDLDEFMVLPGADTTPPPNMNAGLDLTYLPGLKLSANNNMSIGNSTPPARLPNVFAGKAVAQGATGDGTIDLDLGQQYQVSQINLGFFSSNNWAGGGSVQIAATPGAWTTVDDSGRGHTFGPPATGGVKTISFARQTVRFIRITDYFASGVGTSAGRLDEIEVYN
jgi:hypothetical protein